MAVAVGKNRLLSLWRRWRAESFVYCGLLSLVVGLTITTSLFSFWGWPIWSGIPIMAVTFSAMLLLISRWRIQPADIARYLDRQLPELEESCGLLLRTYAELGPLEKLQVARTEARLIAVEMPHPLRKKLLWATGLLMLTCLLNAGIMYMVMKVWVDGLTGDKAQVAVALQEKVVAGIRSVHIRITPPAYTGRVMREQGVFDLRVEEGSLLSWEVQTGDSVDALQFIFNDSMHLSLQPVDAGHTLWRATRAAARSGFYQVGMGGRLSELYTLEVVKDEPPHITIQTPKPYMVLDYGEPMKVPLVVQLRDDYGVADASVVATVASGSGEAVKFKEQVMRFGRAFTGDQPAYDLRQTIDLTALGLKPGDELYFYCRAKDNHGQESRTDMYIISLPDTAQLMSLQGLTMSVDVKPEYFRSERQIIIDIEQLLKEKDSLPVQSFDDRSNNLGIDQKLLRLRYGKFLGEEGEEGNLGGPEDSERPGDNKKSDKAGAVSRAGDAVRPGDVGKMGDAVKAGDLGDVDKILEAYTDKHDNAEDASYFEPAVKEQLKATLTEMWAAELRLRTFKPREALPFAYKALRLLKDLQQKSRAYVAKTGVRVTPLDPAKRLAGKLEGIAPPIQRRTVVEGAPSAEQVLRIALGLLEGVGSEGVGSATAVVIGKGSQEIMQEASRRLGREASERPGEYLAGYQAMRRILEGGGDAGDVLEVQRALRKLLPEAEAVPLARKGRTDRGLSTIYFTHINDPSGKP